MKYFLLLIMVLGLQYDATAQSYADSIARHRQHYKEEFITEERSPLKGDDTAFLRFYKADVKYRVTAVFTPTPDDKPFDMPTYSGKLKQFRQYGTISFVVNKKKLTLQVYQNMKLLEDPKHKDHLFIPFTDATTYTETYGGGRYIDLETTDIRDGKLVIDFNKCYNP
jgi:uncharacterized protein (DUF1684 family)